MKLAIPDLVSNSYFPATAAIELGCFAAEGLDASLSPVESPFKALRDGAVDFVASSAHSTLHTFPEWKGAKLLCTLAQGMYWLLVVRSDLAPRRGDLSVLKGRNIGAAPSVAMGLRRLLIAAGIDAAKEQVRIVTVPGSVGEGSGVNFGLMAAQALEDGKIDGFWANGMGAEVAVRRGVGCVVLDVRRGDGPKECFNYTQPAIVTTDNLIHRSPESAAAVVRGINSAHALLKKDVTLATEVGRKLFPPQEAGLIADLIRRDLPYYDSSISETFVHGMNRFARDVGILKGDPSYADVVAVQFRNLWSRN